MKKKLNNLLCLNYLIQSMVLLVFLIFRYPQIDLLIKQEIQVNMATRVCISIVSKIKDKEKKNNNWKNKQLQSKMNNNSRMKKILI